MGVPPDKGHIRVGIGGWNYEPWRKTFYPAEVTQSRELEYASRHVTSIEINGTFYGLQKPTVFAKWHDSTPESFMFSIKAPRFIVQRKDLASAGTAIERFVSSGITELKAKLGPILWQLADTKGFDPKEIESFLSLLPATAGKLQLRHALEVRHGSFLNRQFLAIARQRGVAVVYEDDATHPGFADLTSAFVYARLRRSTASCATGYSLASLKQWARRAQAWASGKEPTDLPRVAAVRSAAGQPRPVFIFFINGAKERAPAAARKLISLLE
ncbi:MAG TPA: DUF72 domain-containing protein [Steroidobacteraceae bacterium]|nr:DUF72 domain-containing protein [Steroidobacteraceae bacterium]